MGKIAVVTDSNSGITQELAREIGITVVPMPFTIGGQEYLEGINLTHEEFFKKMNEDVEISTSQPSPESVSAAWNKLLEENDEVVHIPMSSALSGSYESAASLAENYGGRVQVVNNQRVSVTQRRSVMDALELAEMGKSAAEIKEVLERTKMESSIYITVVTLKYLKQGGRLTPAVAAIGTMLRLKPVLTIQGEKLDSYYNARTMRQARQVMLDAIKNDIENRFGGMDKKDVYIDMACTDNMEEALDFRAQVEEAFPGFNIGYLDPLSLNVSCHIGPGALAVTATKIQHFS